MNFYLKTICVAGAMAISSWASAIAAPIPEFWKKSMTDDPATNYYVSQALKPLPTQDAQTLRVVYLADLLGHACRGASVNKKALNAFKKSSGYSAITGKAYDEAAFLVDDSVKYVDYRALAHLCAGTGYLFGPQGHLAFGLVKPGVGRPVMSYDPNNPYIRLKSVRKKG